MNNECKFDLQNALYSWVHIAPVQETYVDCKNPKYYYHMALQISLNEN